MSDKFDRAVDQAIIRKVRGEDSWWEIDYRYPAKGRTWEERFTKDRNGRAPGDKQVLLWVIDLYAEKGKRIPKWAADALRTVLLDAAKGKFKTWDDAFGKIMHGRKRRTTINEQLPRVKKVGERIRELRSQRYKFGAGKEQGRRGIWSILEEEKLGGESRLERR